MNEAGELSQTGQIRSFYDYVHCSPEGEGYALQRALLLHMLNPDSSVNRETLESHLPSLCSSSSSFSASQGDPIFSSEDAESVYQILAAELEHYRTSACDAGKGEGSISLSDGLEFAVNLAAMQTAISSASDGECSSISAVVREPMRSRTIGSFADLLQTRGMQQPPAASNTSASSSSTSKVSSIGERKVERIYPSSRPTILRTQSPVPPMTVKASSLIDDTELERKRPNPFKSGKDKYIDEGGVFAAKSREDGDPAVKISQRVFGKQPAEAGGGKETDKPLPPELAHLDKNLVDKIAADIVHKDQNNTKFADIAGLDWVKKCVNELICWPITRPDLFTGLRSLPKGLLLFGPPGTGKTLIGKAIAHESGCNAFFSISASSLTSKWIGEGEMAVRTLFALAAYHQPSVVFLDEVDSLLCQRSSEENEATRRIKTEFLVQLDGAGTDQSARVVVIGATNRPDELDEAARRRFVKRIYVPLPDDAGRRQLILRLLVESMHSLCDEDINELVKKTQGYSGADIRSICTEAAMGPVREVCASGTNLARLDAANMPSISKHHFDDALDTVAPSVSEADLQRYIDWNGTFGTYRKMEG